MKVAIIAFSNLRVTPYLKSYTEIFKKNCIDYDVIYWNRKNENESVECNKLISFDLTMDDNNPKIVKLFYMMRFSLFVKKTINSYNYDYVIVLTTLNGVLLSNFLIHNYKKKYIIDIRDYSYEHIGFYYRKLDALLNNSLLNIISSPSYKEFLPETEYLICHNMTFNDQGNCIFSVNKREKIKIGFVGVIRYADECERILLSIRNHPSIEFDFYGDGEDEVRLKTFCNKNNINNVRFFGRFTPVQKENIYRSIDIIYNCYGNQSNNVKYALSNKFYDSLYYRKPILVNSKTSMADYSGVMGYVVDSYENLADSLIRWYSNLNPISINDYCEKKLHEYIVENDKFACELIKALR